MLYLVVAMDGTDEEAPARRQAARGAHLKEAAELFAGGRLITGGALMEGEKMIGSALLLEADSEADVRALLERDPYTQGDVWRNYRIWPYRKAF